MSRFFKTKVRHKHVHLFVRSYYMLMLWFPELMNRFRWYETSYSGPKNMTNMCEIVSMFYVKPEEADQTCNDDIDKSVYLNIVIIGIACIPTSLIVPLFVNRLGLRFFLGTEFYIYLAIGLIFYFIYIIVLRKFLKKMHTYTSFICNYQCVIP